MIDPERKVESESFVGKKKDGAKVRVREREREATTLERTEVSCFLLFDIFSKKSTASFEIEYDRF